MKSKKELFEERLKRIGKAVALEKPDRTPVIVSNLTFAPKHMGVLMSDYVKDLELMNDTLLRSFLDLKDGDGVQVTVINPLILSLLWLSKIKLPGKELAANEVWQVAEKELLKPEDYDDIISGGWTKFIKEFSANRLDNVSEKLEDYFRFVPQAEKRFLDEGIVNINNGIPMNQPFEILCGGRTMAKFYTDLYRIPDKVEEVMEIIMEETVEPARIAMREIKPFGAWIGGWRSATGNMSPALWERFVWPYIKRLGEAMIAEGAVPIFHLDSDWNRGLEFFREFPKGTCIVSLDGCTDIYKAKEVLGGHMCIMGDVPARMLALSGPDEVYDYSAKLVKDIGQSGFILSSGCDIPANANVENVKAMIAAAGAGD